MDTLYFEDKSKTLEEVNLIKENICEKIEGSTCVDGSIQEIYLKEGERVSPPTVSLEAIFFTLTIGSHKWYTISTFDVPGAYLHSEIP